jgi:predicted AAA+ superfamily ATPase
MLKRFLNVLNLMEKKSHFLFGARGTGKSYLIDQMLSGHAEILSLLQSDLYLELSQTPSRLRQIVEVSKHSWFVIDEIQRIPELLNEVHWLLQNDKEKKMHFLLTGSSARKLKRENANMLGGRARRASLYPLTLGELINENQLDIGRYLNFGGLPSVYLSQEPYAELRDYIDTYLNEEIKAEAGVRNLPAFSRFLKVAGIYTGQQINFTKMASDAQVKANTLREHFSILIDTLLGLEIEPWAEGKSRKPVATSKFYFTDCGLANAAAGIKEVLPQSERWGSSLEQAIALEINAYLSYSNLDFPLNYWRTDTGVEVDFIIDGRVGIEVKSSMHTTNRDHKHLIKLREEGQFSHLILVNLSSRSSIIDGVLHLSLTDFVSRLWSKEFF